MEKSIDHCMIEGIVVLAEADAPALAQVRTLPGLQVGQAPGELWLRGIPLGDRAPLEVRKLPIQQSYTKDKDDRLFLRGALTPTRTLPGLTWIPVATFVQVEPPTSALPGQMGKQISVDLVRKGPMKAPEALLLDLATWRSYAETAPAVRLSSLRFSVSQNMQVMVLGSPLPPLPGQALYRKGSLLLPCGFDFAAAIMGELIEQKFNPIGDHLLYFHSSGDWDRIPLRSFVAATRSAVRLSPLHPPVEAP